jgi:serine/threonine-protein kinase
VGGVVHRLVPADTMAPVARVPSRRIGHHEVIRELGRGGMGVVYLGRDTRLDRNVAIKALPAELAADPARLDRFEREARILAQLNHPNVAGIHGVEEQEGQQYLVLEFVEGETLADRLDAGPLPVDEALEVAVQIAAGVEAAHEAGVIHRDLKPGNVIITPDGHAKVLDFGLARADETSSSPSGPDDPTQTSPARHSPTMPGVILGTAAYMSPEQARGRRVDKRTDIWSFGVVLYEMLTGASPFTGETVSDSIGAVLHKDLDLDRLPPGTPESVRRVLRRCLRRDKAQRFRDIGDVRIELADGSDERPETGRAESHRALVPAAALIGGIVLGGLLGYLLKPAGNASRGEVTTRRSEVAVPRGGTIEDNIALSPDGRQLVYVSSVPGGSTRLVLRRLEGFEDVEVRGTENGDEPFFSPDGRWLGFSAEGFIRKVPVNGGEPVNICRGEAFGAVWLDDGTIVFGEFGTGLWRVPASGGEPEPLTTLDRDADELSHARPVAAPDRDTILFTVGTGAGSRIGAVSLSSGERKTIAASGADPKFLSDELVVLFMRGQLQVASFDARSTSLESPVPVLDGVQWDSHGGTEHGAFALSANGTLAYVPGSNRIPRTVPVIVDRAGASQPIAVPAGTYLHPALSSDGRYVAMTKGDDVGTGSIWIVDLQRGAVTRLTSDDASYTPIWTPDDSHVTYVSNGNITSAPASGIGDPVTVFEGEAYERPRAWTPDGEAVLFETTPGTDIHILRNGSEVETIVATRFDERHASLSPDGRHLAYVSDATGRDEVYARSIVDPVASVVVSIDGGFEPRWSADGGELFFRSNQGLMSATVRLEPELVFDRPRLLFADSFHRQPEVHNYDVFPSGDKFLMLDPAGGGDGDRFRIVHDWLAEVRAAIAAE